LFFEKRLLKKEKGNQLISGEKEHSRMIKADREEGLSGLSRLYIFSKARGAKREANFVTRNPHETRGKSLD
tara:strand:- start:130 stop:342 length:213 start_codon:yes stop_codon:yes gene_type:complete